jgi:hypothetical protein
MIEGRRVREIALLALAGTLAASGARSAEPISAPAPATRVPPVSPPARTVCPNCCQVAVEAAPRMGVSLNADQWLLGGQLRTFLPCLGHLGLGPLVALGIGGNHLTLKSGGHLDYMLWFDDAHVFGVYPAVGGSVRFYWPVGPFATFCHRVGLEECSGYDLGGEVGGGFRYRAFSVDAFVGFGGLPVLSIMAAMSFSLSTPEDA